MQRNKIFSNFFHTITTGFFLVLPLAAVILIGTKLWQLLVAPAKKLAGLADIDTIFIIDIIIIVFLVLICFAAGLAIKAKSVDSLKNWLEDNVLRMIPGYEYLRMRLMASFAKANNASPKCVAIRFDDYTGLGILIEQKENGKSVVFLPGIPEFSGGDIAIVDSERIIQLGISMNEMSIMIRSYGKGMLEKLEKYV